MKRNKGDWAHQNREKQWLRMGANVGGEEDKVVPSFNDLNYKNENGEGISEALDEKGHMRRSRKLTRVATGTVA